MATITNYGEWINSAWRGYITCETVEDNLHIARYITDFGVEVKSGVTVTFDVGYLPSLTIGIRGQEWGGGAYNNGIVCKAGITSLVGIIGFMEGFELPYKLDEYDKDISVTPSQNFQFHLTAFNYVKKTSSSSKRYTSDTVDGFPSIGIIEPFDIPKVGSPTLTITATRSERTNLTVVAQITSFNGDEISASTLKVGDIVIRGGLGTGTIGADGRLTLTKQITNIPTSSLPIQATVTGRGGVSDEATYTLPVAFTTWDVKAGGKEISFGEDATEEDLPSNGLFNCAMDANFKGRLLHNGEEISGGPTESGIENGWYYEIWPNGKRECWKRLTGTWTLNNANGGMYSTPVIPGGAFPEGLFSDLPALDVKGFALTGDLTLIGIAVSPASETATNKKASKDNFGCFRLVRGNSNTSTAVKYVTLHALQLPEA